MMQSFLRGLLSLSIVSAALGLALRADVLLPHDDPFYTQPANISAYQPGEIIASRSVEIDLNGILGFSLTPISINATYQYLYRTVDSFQNPVAAVTTVLVPHDADPSKLLSYQTAYDSANINCGPSYSLQAGANNVAVVDIIMVYLPAVPISRHQSKQSMTKNMRADSFFLVQLIAALDKGFYIVSSDYEGLNGALTSGLQAGYATLDSVRAALSAPSTTLTGLSPDARYALWGYSGGSIATEWAAELHPTYAPDLTNFQGAAAGGLIANMTNVILTINDGLFAGLGFAGMQGLSNAYPEVAAVINASFASEEKEADFRAISAQCLVPLLAAGAFHDFNAYFTDFGALLHNDVVRTVMNETGQMGHTGVPTMPLFVYKAVLDEVSPVADTDYVVEALCSQGARIEYQKNLVGEHSTEDILRSGSALAWIEDRLAGKAVTSTGCSTEFVVATEVDVETTEAFGLELIAFLQNILGGSIGPYYSG